MQKRLTHFKDFLKLTVQGLYADQIAGNSLCGLKSTFHKKTSSSARIPYFATEMKSNRGEYDILYMYKYILINHKAAFKDNEAL